MPDTHVDVALEMLIEAVDSEVMQLVGEGKRAFEESRWSDVTALAEAVKRTQAFRNRVADLGPEWARVTSPITAARPMSNILGAPPSAPKRRILERAPPGEKLPLEEYFHPILLSLEEIGGRGSLHDVLPRVFDKVKHRLSAVDLEGLASTPNEPRWRNTAQWARSRLGEAGLLSSTSRRGIWELSDKGRAWLRTHSSTDARILP